MAMSAARFPVVGENLLNDVIAVWVDEATAVVSVEVFTVNVEVPVALAAVANLGLSMPAACVNVIVKVAPTPRSP
jgi:hypothetical protein